MSELWQLSALELADADPQAGGEQPRGPRRPCSPAIDAVNGHLNAVVALLPEAVAAADAADRAVADGGELGPLHGVPITVKENIDVAGSATTQGVAALEHAIASVDAPVVERMRAAGAIPFARTNLPDFGLRVHTDSQLRGLTRNPWNPDVTAGGSSGGEASALASGMTPLGLGNDIGGSLRNPAHCCGIASIKPSTGVVPHASSLPPVESTIMFQLMAVQGVMARRVADVRAGLLAVAGPHRRDPLALPVTLDEPSPGVELRVAVVAEPPGGDTDPGIAAAVRAAADALADAGHVVEEAVPVSYARVFELWAGLLMADISAAARAARRGDGRRRAEVPRLRERRRGRRSTSPAIVGMHLERNAADLEWHSFLSDWDVLLSPTWTQPAFAHGADLASADAAMDVLVALRPVLPANLLGLPAAVVPCGIADGLPVGAQFTARRFGDLTALAAAQAVEDAIGPLTPIDPVLG